MKRVIIVCKCVSKQVSFSSNNAGVFAKTSGRYRQLLSTDRNAMLSTDTANHLSANSSQFVELRFAKLTENAITPTRGSKLAAGFDLHRFITYFCNEKCQDNIFTVCKTSNWISMNRKECNISHSHTPRVNVVSWVRIRARLSRRSMDWEELPLHWLRFANIELNAVPCTLLWMCFRLVSTNIWKYMLHKQQTLKANQVLHSSAYTYLLVAVKC